MIQTIIDTLLEPLVYTEGSHPGRYNGIWSCCFTLMTIVFTYVAISDRFLTVYQVSIALEIIAFICAIFALLSAIRCVRKGIIPWWQNKKQDKA